MMSNEHERGRAIVNDGRAFGLAKDGERAFEISSAIAPVSGRQIELYIIIGRSDAAEHFARALGQRRATKICVNDNTGAIDHWLNATGAQFFDCGADKID